MGEAQNIALLAEQNHDGLFRWAQALSSWDREEAMEIVQQTYLEVLEGRADLVSAKDPKRFLFGVARNVAASRRRKRSVWGRILRLQLIPESKTSTEASGDLDVESSENSKRIAEAFSKLPKRQAEVLTLVFNESLTVEEAAVVMGVSVGSARTHYHRGKERLKTLLEDLADE